MLTLDGSLEGLSTRSGHVLLGGRVVTVSRSPLNGTTRHGMGRTSRRVCIHPLTGNSRTITVLGYNSGSGSVRTSFGRLNLGNGCLVESM